MPKQRRTAKYHIDTGNGWWISKQEEKFCYSYVAWLDGKKSAMEAGWKEISAKATARNLLLNPGILAVIDRLNQENLDRLKLTQAWVIQQTIEAYHEARQGEPILMWDPQQQKHVDTGERKKDWKAIFAALHELGLYTGLGKNDNNTQVAVLVSTPDRDALPEYTDVKAIPIAEGQEHADSGAVEKLLEEAVANAESA
jgi:hypothetical protein